MEDGTVEFTGLDAGAARAFAERWLPAWTGNDPLRLVSFYTDDAVYSDPAIRGGIQGRQALLDYFTVLLARNPQWVWLHKGSIPLVDGFVNLWHASIPVGGEVVEVDGLCTVQLRRDLIHANHVYFDRTELVRKMGGARRPGV